MLDMSGSANRLRFLAALAMRATESALSLDEKGLRSEAERGYEKAANGLRRALNVQVRFQAACERPSIVALRNKLEKHLKMVEDRLADIRRILRGKGKAGKGGYSTKLNTKGGWASEMERRIEMDILDRSPGVRWDDVSGLEGVKAALKEMVVLPARRPDLYQGLRSPSRGLLLFGPPGAGKTHVAKAVASESEATFFCISASSLASKYHGESEQLVKALFDVAKRKQPSFIFIDEIDSILGKRGGDEHEASRRLKTEFLCMFDGASSNSEERIFIMGATNRPQDLDEAVRRRLVKRFYVPLPDAAGRADMMKKLMQKPGVRWDVSDDERYEVAAGLEWFSGSDMNALCREAALMPLRELGAHVHDVPWDLVRPVVKADLLHAKGLIRPSVSRQELLGLEAWTREFGTQVSPLSQPRRSSSMPAAGGGDIAAAARTQTRRRSTDAEYFTRSKKTSWSAPYPRTTGRVPRLPRPKRSNLRGHLSTGVQERRSGERKEGGG